jgi:RNA polymerase sigma factor (sigma-70 family)
MDQKNKIADLYQEGRSAWKAYVISRAKQLSEMDAEDIVQGTMAAVLNCLHVGEPIHNLTGYIYRALRNTVTDWLRKDKAPLSLNRNDTHLMDLLADTGAGPEAQAVKKEEARRLYEAIDRLSPEKRQVLVATELMGYSYQSLADAWDVPVGTLLARKHRAVRELRTMLERKETI